MHIHVVLNAASGAGAAVQIKDRLEELLRASGRSFQIALASTIEEIEAAVQAGVAGGAAVVVAGGGDGTVSAVAAGIVGHDVALGILPLGSFNHFAKDLGVPLELDPAVAVILAGSTARVDLGEANGRVFLNNASLGLYPEIVRQRQRHPATGWRRRLVAFWITLKVLARHHSMAVRLTVGDEVALRRTPIVFVGNNEYRAAGLAAGTRPTLAGGTLAIYVVVAGGRSHPLRLIRLAWHMVRGVALDSDRLELVRAAEATVESRARRLHMALDGEVGIFRPPLIFRIRPGALRVLVPDNRSY